MNICIYGASSNKIDKIYKEECFNLGKTLAKRGHTLVYGAGGEGLMGASAEGFTAGGGYVHGVIPNFFKEQKFEAIYDKCDKLTFTETMAERKTIMEDECDVFIVVPGGVGTFDELFQIITLKQLGRLSKPIIVYNINGYYDLLNKFFLDCVDKKFINEECKKIYKTFNTAEEVIDYVENGNENIDYNKLKTNKK